MAKEKKKAKAEKKAKAAKVDLTECLDEMGCPTEANADGEVTLEGGQVIAATKFRIYFLNPADGLEVPEAFGDSETQIRKADAAVGIKYLKDTPRSDILALLEFVKDADIYEEPEPDPDEGEGEGDDKTGDDNGKATGDDE